MIRFNPFVASSNCSSSAVSGSLWFRTSKIKSASANALRLLSTPIRSTTSSVSRIPAVSINLSGTPRTLTYSSITSLVVPAMSVTIAFSSLNKWFNKLDLPTFGRPIIAVLNPSRRTFPCLDVASSAWILCWIICAFSSNNFVVNSSTSSYSG